jgi:uroporphyrinogen decarboxylase
MRPKERFLAPFEGEGTDHPPLFYQHLGAGREVLRSTGVTMEEAMGDAEVFAKVCKATNSIFGFDDLMCLWGDILVEAHAHGTPWEFRRTDDYPRPGRYPLSDPTMVDSIVPVDPMDDPYWSVLLKAAGMLMDDMGDELAIIGGMNSPFLVASEIRSYDGLILDTLLEPDAAERLLEIVTESLLICVEHFSDIGIDLVFIDDATAGSQQNTWELCERFDVRFAKRVTDSLHSKGIRTILHNCAEEPFIMEQVELIRPSAMHFAVDSVPPETVDSIPSEMVIIPGVDHRHILYEGGVDRIVDGTMEVLERYHDRRMVMAPACEMALDTPPGYVLVFKDTVEGFRPS